MDKYRVIRVSDNRQLMLVSSVVCPNSKYAVVRNEHATVIYVSPLMPDQEAEDVFNTELTKARAQG